MVSATKKERQKFFASARNIWELIFFTLLNMLNISYIQIGHFLFTNLAD
jgi:hypothetical protein